MASEPQIARRDGFRGWWQAERCRPDAKLIVTWHQPVDTFRGKNVISDTTMEAGGTGERKATGIYDTLIAGPVDEQHAMLKGIRKRETRGGNKNVRIPALPMANP